MARNGYGEVVGIGKVELEKVVSRNRKLTKEQKVDGGCVVLQ